MQILLINKSISILINHVEGFLELLNLGLVEHSKDIWGSSLGSLFCRRATSCSFSRRHFLKETITSSILRDLQESNKALKSRGVNAIARKLQIEITQWNRCVGTNFEILLVKHGRNKFTICERSRWPVLDIFMYLFGWLDKQLTLMFNLGLFSSWVEQRFIHNSTRCPTLNRKVHSTGVLFSSYI